MGKKKKQPNQKNKANDAKKKGKQAKAVPVKKKQDRIQKATISTKKPVSGIYQTLPPSVEQHYKSAGVIPYAVVPQNGVNTVFMLLGQEFRRERHVWCGFSGRRESYDGSVLDCAMREFNEESGFIFNESFSDLRESLTYTKTPKIWEEEGSCATFLIRVDYIENLQERYRQMVKEVTKNDDEIVLDNEEEKEEVNEEESSHGNHQPGKIFRRPVALKKRASLLKQQQIRLSNLEFKDLNKSALAWFPMSAILEHYNSGSPINVPEGLESSSTNQVVLYPYFNQILNLPGVLDLLAKLPERPPLRSYENMKPRGHKRPREAIKSGNSKKMKNTQSMGPNNPKRAKREQTQPNATTTTTIKTENSSTTTTTTTTTSTTTTIKTDVKVKTEPTTESHGDDDAEISRPKKRRKVRA